ncbi:MAG: hypothetical protein R3F14_36235 [Polyangiaceae bacterium]
MIANALGMAVAVIAGVEEMKVRIEYGLWVKGSRSYQVMAFVSEASYPIVKADLEAILESFEPAP